MDVSALLMVNVLVDTAMHQWHANHLVQPLWPMGHIWTVAIALMAQSVPHSSVIKLINANHLAHKPKQMGHT